MKCTRLTHVLVALVAMMGTALAQTSVVSSPHNLSATGPGTVKADSEQQVCIFCHTPHNATADAPLWDRDLASTVYTIYSSTTLDASPGQPTGTSKLCLSCHDGTIALGSVRSRSTPIVMAGGVTTMPAGSRANLDSDLSDDHPLSFVYNSALAGLDPQIVDPSLLPLQVRLDDNGELQCAGCHDPHDNSNGNFLTLDNTQSALCTTCHQIDGWSQTDHRTSTATWNAGGLDPWPESDLTTVADNACGNCHLSHKAGYPARLLRRGPQEDTCLACHDGSVAGGDINSLVSLTSRHNVGAQDVIHDPLENPVTAAWHVECTDCHNPHYARHLPATPPAAPGALDHVSGVTSAGVLVDQVTYDYELCYKCHGDNPNRIGAIVPRHIVQTNVRLEFDPSSISYHPIEAPGKSTDVPSLIGGWTTGSTMTCGDCHNSPTGTTAGGSGPDGPHGSQYTPLLIAQFETADNTVESPQAYALCYRCHDRTSILANESFGRHSNHIAKGPCSMCHESHGITSTQGNATNNARLLNWDTSIVFPNRNGLLEWVDLGERTGECSMMCHNHNHRGSSY